MSSLQGKAFISVMYGVRIVLIWEGVQEQLDELCKWAPLAIRHYANRLRLFETEEATAVRLVRQNLNAYDPTHLADIVMLYWLVGQRDADGQVIRECFIGRKWEVTFFDAETPRYQVNHFPYNAVPKNFEPMSKN